MADVFTSKNWGLWVQPDGPNSEAYFLGCHDVDDVTESGGGTSLIRCFKPDGSGWKIIGATIEPPDAIDIKITTPIGQVADWLETLRCPATLYITGHKCGRRDMFTGWQRAFVFNLAAPGDRGLSGLAKREEDTVSEMSFSFSARPPVLRLYEMSSQRLSTAEDQVLRDVYSCSQQKCADACGEASRECDTLYAVAEADAGVTANVLRSGTTAWAALTADPFGNKENIMAIACFAIDADTTRILVARGSVAANPAGVAYSDDDGATWTTVEVGSVNGQAALGGGSLLALDMHHVWLVTSGGYVYFSDDGGEGWTVQDGGIAAGGDDLYAISAADEDVLMAVGESGTVIMTRDGGETWSSATSAGGNNLVAVTYNPYGIWFAGSSTGKLYFSNDDGETWYERTGWPGSSSGNITDIAFVNEVVGFMTHNVTAGTGYVLRTPDGGYTWERIAAAENAVSLYALHACNENLVYAVGDIAADGYATILKVSGGKQ
jgi:hypothetical protein